MYIFQRFLFITTRPVWYVADNEHMINNEGNMKFMEPKTWQQEIRAYLMFLFLKGVTHLVLVFNK